MLLGLRWVVVSGMCVSVSLIWAWIRGEGLLCQLHYSWAWVSTTHPLSLFPCPLQNLWFANPGGSNSMPSQSRSSVQRTHSLPVHSSPQAILMFPPGKVL